MSWASVAWGARRLRAEPVRRYPDWYLAQSGYWPLRRATRRHCRESPVRASYSRGTQANWASPQTVRLVPAAATVVARLARTRHLRQTPPPKQLSDYCGREETLVPRAPSHFVTSFRTRYGSFGRELRPIS